MAEELADSAETVRWFGQTDVGRFRKDNQDSFPIAGGGWRRREAPR